MHILISLCLCYKFMHMLISLDHSKNFGRQILGRMKMLIKVGVIVILTKCNNISTEQFYRNIQATSSEGNNFETQNL